MKKSLFFCLLFAIASILVAGCSSCKPENNKQDDIKDVEVLSLSAETTISTDREAMYLRTPKDAKILWMQTGVLLSDKLSDENVADAKVMEVMNGFQTQVNTETGINTKVTLITTNTQATDSLVLNGSFFFDNYPLNDKEINITFEKAVEKILEANCPKPQTRAIILRSPVGPVHVDDAYYIAGSGDDDTPMVFVNARTGDVTTENPAWKKN